MSLLLDWTGFPQWKLDFTGPWMQRVKKSKSWSVPEGSSCSSSDSLQESVMCFSVRQREGAVCLSQLVLCDSSECFLYMSPHGRARAWKSVHEPSGVSALLMDAGFSSRMFCSFSHRREHRVCVRVTGVIWADSVSSLWKSVFEHRNSSSGCNECLINPLTQ